ncbi:hypothetical protein CHS0354_003942, partial [Potamilus streckersoni]
MLPFTDEAHPPPESANVFWKASILSQQVLNILSCYKHIKSKYEHEASLLYTEDDSLLMQYEMQKAFMDMMEYAASN